MKKQLLYVLLAFTATFYGCGNDDDPTPTPAPNNPNNPGNPQTCRLVGTTTNGAPSLQVIYDASNRMVRQNLYNNGQVSDYNLITYNAAGRIDSVKQYMDIFSRIYIITKFTYNPVTGQASGMEVYNYDLMSGTYILNTKFVYNLNNENQIQLQYGYDASGLPNSELQFQYLNGNQTKAIQYVYVNGVRTYYDTKTFTHDSKPNPIYQWHMPYSHFNYASANNITQVQAVLANQSVNQERSYSSVFEYDSNNYPSKEVRTYGNGTVHTFVYQYTCP